MSVAVTVVAPAAPEAVWRRLADLPRWPEWTDRCIAAEARGPMQPGTPLVLHLRHPRGRGFYTRPRLTVVEPERRLGWAATSLGLRAAVGIALEAEPDGTRVTLVADATGRLAVTYRVAMPEKTQALLYAGMLDGLTDSFR